MGAYSRGAYSRIYGNNYIASELRSVKTQPLLFAIALIPLGLEIAFNRREIHHLLLMADLKLFLKNKKSLNSLIQTAMILSKAVGMNFGIEKRAMLLVKNGYVAMVNMIKLRDESLSKLIHDGKSSKYLIILQ